MNARGQKPDMKTLRPATQLVHGGTMRSPFGETSEALFLTQGYAYPDMETAEARMKGAEPGYVFALFNPTVDMFQSRMALLEGAEAARATASGMAAVTTALMAQLRRETMWSQLARCSEPVFMWSKICCRASASHRPLSMVAIWPNGARRCGRKQSSCSEIPDQSMP